MVHKIRILVLFLILIILGFFSFTINGNVETNLLRTLLPKSVINSTDIIKIADKTASDIKVVFESDSEKELNNLKEDFIKKVNSNYFELQKFDYTGLISTYVNSPTNFLSYNTRILLKNKKYDEVYAQGLNRIYNPVSIQLSNLDKDPYLFVDDFILSLPQDSAEVRNNNEKFYDYLLLKMKTQDGLSPDLANKKISELVKIQKELSKNGNIIYLAGSPIHSYYTSTRAVVSINTICILSILMIAFLTYFYFRTFTPLIPIGFCILCGMFAGYDITKLWFKDFQIITMVFASTLIGIGIDYSYHYFFDGKNKNFKKNLTLSLITTIIPFILLYLTGIELLKQISVFTVFGLITIYAIIMLIYPATYALEPQRTVSINKKAIKLALLVLCIFSLIGFFKLNFNDSLTSLYTPSKDLLKAENLYNNVSGGLNTESRFIEVKGENLEEILKAEENITDKLREENIDFVSLSTFIPSQNRQKENFELVKDLYQNNPNNFSDILTKEQIRNLKEQTFKPVIYNLSGNSLLPLKNFMLDENTSLTVVKSSQKINTANVIDLKSSVAEYMKNYRKITEKVLPISIMVIFILLASCYGIKRGAKMLIPSICGIIGAFGFTLLIIGEANVFSLIALFMTLGFTIDYSIFRIENKKETEDAILVSAVTTAFSFFLLSLCGFKILSLISLILFFGILTAYLIGILIKENL